MLMTNEEMRIFILQIAILITTLIATLSTGAAGWFIFGQVITLLMCE